MSTEGNIFSPCDNSPCTLFALCMDVIVNNINVIATVNPTNRCRNIHDEIVLPVKICEGFLEAYQRQNYMNDKIANLFRDRNHVSLKTVKLKNSQISNEGLLCFMSHKPYVVELIQCEYISLSALEIINANSQNLISLKIGPMTYLISNDENMYRDRGYIINAPNLKSLTIQCSDITLLPLLKPFTKLTHLDLSECTLTNTKLVLPELQSLRFLVLYSVHLSKDILKWILSLHNLTHLDLSQSNESHGIYFNPSDFLSKIVTSSPKLEYLDISGTNLAGIEVAKNSSSLNSPICCDIPGLLSRVNSPLKFLGLYSTLHGACKRNNIPAKTISGDANVEQIFTAATIYMRRPAILKKVLDDMCYLLLKCETNSHLDKALSLTLIAMREHITDKIIQKSGGINLFYIMEKKKGDFGGELKRNIITTLLNGMEAHSGDKAMIHVICIIFSQFDIPTDFLFQYNRVIKILLAELFNMNSNSIAKKIFISLLNKLIDHIKGWQKLYFCNPGAVKMLLPRKRRFTSFRSSSRQRRHNINPY